MQGQLAMNAKPIRALLIEDDPGFHLLLERSLNKCRSRFSLTWADRLLTGLDALRSQAFDVVLTDLSLPDAAGLETVRRIRECDTTTPIVVLTALDDPGVEAKAIDSGAQDYLVKGEIAPNALERVIQHAIQRQETIAQIERLLADVQASEQLLAENKLQLEAKNRRLRKLYKTAQRFVDNVSHEFRTPLTVVKDYISLVREGMVGEVNEEQRRMLDVAAVRANDLNNMVDDMLDISRLQSGLLGVWRRRGQIADIIADVVPALAQKAAVKEIAFEVDAAHDIPDIYCDNDKVARVIINLVTNAMKFCGEPGQVRLWIRAEPANDQIVIGVTDNGPGIPADQLELLFRRFKQLKGNFKSSTKGFGLGLNIAKELVGLNLGEIRVESVVGQGSTFSFTVPTASPHTVMERYVERAITRKNGGCVISLIDASIDEMVSDADAEDVDAFFNYMLRQHDLLFRRGTHDWLVVLSAANAEIDDYLQRIRREHCKANRNRPFGALAPFTMHCLGSWNVKEQRMALMAEFDKAVMYEKAALAN
jgi:signal transduction histidine kinase